MKISFSIFPKVLFFLLLAGSISSCSKDGCTDPNALNYDSEAKNDDGTCTYENAEEQTSVKVTLHHRVDGETLEFNTINYSNDAGNDYSVVRLHYYISDITLVNSDGDNHIVDVIHYVDATQSATLEMMLDSLPKGSYTAVSFRFGISPEKNHVDSGYLPGTPEHVGMFWPEQMGGGYHFMKLEGRYEKSNDSLENYNTHLGGLVMMGDDYSSSFVTEVFNLDEPIVITEEDSIIELPIVMNINNWYSNPNNYDMNDYDDGIMNKPAVQTMLKENGAENVFSVER
ncbi:MAG: MbnP family protein [Bacteroidia bacterium]